MPVKVIAGCIAIGRAPMAVAGASTARPWRPEVWQTTWPSRIAPAPTSVVTTLLEHVVGDGEQQQVARTRDVGRLRVRGHRAAASRCGAARQRSHRLRPRPRGRRRGAPRTVRRRHGRRRQPRFGPSDSSPFVPVPRRVPDYSMTRAVQRYAAPVVRERNGWCATSQRSRCASADHEVAHRDRLGLDPPAVSPCRCSHTCIGTSASLAAHSARVQRARKSSAPNLATSRAGGAASADLRVDDRPGVAVPPDDPAVARGGSGSPRRPSRCGPDPQMAQGPSQASVRSSRHRRPRSTGR